MTTAIMVSTCFGPAPIRLSVRWTLAIDDAFIAAMYIWKSGAGRTCSVIRMLVVLTSSRRCQSAAWTSSRRVDRRRVHSESSAADITCAWMPPTSRHTDASVDPPPFSR
jgi:hypothetical protein